LADIEQLFLDFLNENPIFSVASENWRERLIAQSVTRDYAPSAIVFSEGDTSDKIYIILNGSVSIETYSADGNLLVFSSLSSPEVFGHFGVIDKAPRSATVRTTSEAIIATISAETFEAYHADNRDAGIAIAKDLVRIIRKNNYLLQQIKFATLQQRVAQQLLHRITRPTDPQQAIESRTLSVNMTQTQIAEFVSGSRERVNSSLKKLEDAGLIKRGRGSVTILDVQRLQRHANPTEQLVTL